MFSLFAALGLSRSKKRRCGHVHVHGKHNPRNYSWTMQEYKEQGFFPIRLEIDYSYINGTIKDPKRCYNAGDVVKWDNTYTCTKQDVATDKQTEIIVKTLENVKAYMQNVLYVQKLKEGFDLTNFSDYTDIPPNIRVQNVDMHFTAFFRPFSQGSEVIACGAAVQLDGRFFRPIQGVIFINPVYIGEVASNYDDWDNEYFYVLVHEMCHAFGINPSLYGLYHPVDSQTPHENITCHLSKGGKNFTFLNSPQAHKYAVKHFGQEYFYGDNGQVCWSGIELEDGGGQGTAMAHPESRVYVGEMMVGVNIQTNNGPFNRLTDVSMSFLVDSGNYKINYQWLKPMVWGSKYSVDGNPISGFATDPAQLSFPQYYLYNKTYDDNVGFDFKFSGENDQTKTFSCPNSNPETSPYCYGKDFFNVLDDNNIGSDWPYDYIPFKFPNMVCPPGQAILPGMIECGNYSCNNFSDFTIITVNKDSYNRQKQITCTKNNLNFEFKYTVYQAWSINNIVVNCVDPERFCRSVTLEEMNYASDPFEMNTDIQLKPLSQTFTIPTGGISTAPIVILIVVLTILGVALVIFVIVLAVCLFCKKRKSQNHDHAVIHA